MERGTIREMRAVLVTLVVTTFACGGHPPVPQRCVVESDLGSWKFRRFQGPMLDPDVYVENNRGEAFSASYITEDAEKRGRIEDQDLVNVTVTRYANPEGVVRATVKFARRLAAERGYQVEEDKIAGARALTITGPDEMWVLWPAKAYIVKIGGRGRKDVPKSMVEKYADRYPSQLPGGALEGPLPPGPDDTPKKVDKPEYDPKNPRPDIDKYDPSKVKLPEHEKDSEDSSPPPDDDAPKKKKTKRSK